MLESVCVAVQIKGDKDLGIESERGRKKVRARRVTGGG